MKAQKLLTSIIIATIVLFIGCEKDDFVETIGLCPVVESTTPANNATFVPLDQVITASFNEAMIPGTFTASSFKVQQGTTSIGGTISYADKTVTFTPSANLTPNTTYTAVITTSVKDLKGNALQENYVWTFSTGGTVTPVVIATDPANSETDVFLNKKVLATFNMPMYALTINTTTFTVKQGTTAVAGTVALSGTTAVFTPSVSFLPNTVYTATITTGAQNVSGTPLTNNYVWTFTTGTTVAPIVNSTDPVSNASGVALNKIITADFSMPMNASTFDNTTFIVKQGTTTIPGTVSYAGITATFTPNSNLLSNMTYTATITIGIDNLACV